MVGDDRADRVALAVVRLLAEQDQVGLLGLEHLGERVAGGADVGALERGVGQVDRAVGAERDRLVQRAHRALGAHRHGDDLLDLGALPPSRICIAASMPWVSNGFRFFSPERSSRLVSGSIRFWTAASGTSLTRQQIFKSGSSFRDERRAYYRDHPLD